MIQPIRNNDIKKFQHAEEVITSSRKGTAIGYENGPVYRSGYALNQHIIEQMFQDILQMEQINETAKEMKNNLMICLRQ